MGKTKQNVKLKKKKKFLTKTYFFHLLIILNLFFSELSVDC